MEVRNYSHRPSRGHRPWGSPRATRSLGCSWTKSTEFIAMPTTPPTFLESCGSGMLGRQETAKQSTVPWVPLVTYPWNNSKQILRGEWRVGIIYGKPVWFLQFLSVCFCRCFAIFCTMKQGKNHPTPSKGSEKSGKHIKISKGVNITGPPLLRFVERSRTLIYYSESSWKAPKNIPPVVEWSFFSLF